MKVSEFFNNDISPLLLGAFYSRLNVKILSQDYIVENLAIVKIKKGIWNPFFYSAWVLDLWQTR